MNRYVAFSACRYRFTLQGNDKKNLEKRFTYQFVLVYGTIIPPDTLQSSHFYTKKIVTTNVLSHTVTGKFPLSSNL